MAATEASKRAAKRTYYTRREQGLCVRCANPSPDQVFCPSCKEKRATITKAYWQHRPDKRREKARRYTKKIRQEALDAYGTSCVCCGDSRNYVLELDHIYGGGRQQAKDDGSYFQMLAKLRAQNWPPIIQTLCANCHLAKTRLGACPKDHSLFASTS